MEVHMDIYEYNQKAWTNASLKEDKYTIALSDEEITAAKSGEWKFKLTPTKLVPQQWFGDINGKNVLCLAASGGQQAPLLAILGANVTVFDICQEQLNKDNAIAKKFGLNIKTKQGNMLDLSCFDNESFDIIVHAVSNCFIENVTKVWEECFRVLKPNGIMIASFLNPVNYLFDMDALKNGEFIVKYTIPYSDLQQLNKSRLNKYMNQLEPIEFGHTLEDQIGGQLKAGFKLYGLYEDSNGGLDPLDKYIDIFIVTLAKKTN